MSLVNIFVNQFKGSNILRATVDGKGVYIPIDCITDESFDIPAEITSHPVENNIDVSDHIILRPKKLKLEGVISASPLDLSASLQGAVSAATLGIASSIGNVLGPTGNMVTGIAGGYAGQSIAGLLGVGTSGNRLTDAVTELIKARDSRSPVEIQTGLRKYPSGPDANYYIAGLSIKRDKSTGQSIHVSIEFQEVLVAVSTTVIVTYPKTKQGSPNTNKGKQDGSQVTGANASSATVLAKIVDYGKRIIGLH